MCFENYRKFWCIPGGGKISAGGGGCGGMVFGLIYLFTEADICPAQ
jgi:hypothetical protein